MCVNREMKTGRKRSRIPVLIDRQDRFKVKRRKLDMCSGETGREEEVLVSQESSHLEVESIKNVPQSPASLFNNNLMLQAFGGFLLFLTKKGKILFVSENVEDYLGFSQEEMISHSITEFISPAYYHEIHNNIKIRKPKHHHHHHHSDASDILTTVHSRDFCIEMKHKIRKVEDKILNNNSLVMTKWSGQVKVRPSLKSKGYSTIGLLCLCRPVQSSAILEVRMKGQMFMSRHNMDMTYIYCEKRIVTLIGYEPNDLIGKSCYQFHNPLDVQKISSCHSNLLAKGASTSKYYRFLGKNGDWVWMQTQATIIYDAESKARYVVCMNYIISKEDGEKYLKFEEEQNGIPDPQIHGCIDLTSTRPKPIAITHTETSVTSAPQTHRLTVIQPNLVPTGLQPNLAPTGLQPNLVTTGLQPNLVPTGLQPKLVTSGLQPTSGPSELQPTSEVQTGKQSNSTSNEAMAPGTVADWSNIAQSVSMTSVTDSIINSSMDIDCGLNMDVGDEDDLFDLDLEVPPSLLPIDKVKVTSVASLTQNSDPLLCPLSKDSNILTPAESTSVEPQSSVAMEIDNDFSILDDLLENINHFSPTSLSSPAVASTQEMMEVDHCSRLPDQNQSKMTSQIMTDKIVTNENSGLKITSVKPMLKDSENTVQKSCQLFSMSSEKLQDDTHVQSKDTDACQPNSSFGSLLRSLLHRESPPPKTQPPKTPNTSSPSSLASSIPIIQNAQNKSKSSFYTTSTSGVSSNQSLLSAVLEGNATLNIPTCKKTVPISVKNAHLIPRRVMPPQSRYIQRPDQYKKTFCSHGHSCQGLARPVYQTINVKKLSDFTFLKNFENCGRVNDSSNVKLSENDSQDVELPDDLLDLHIQYCDGLAEDQTQALLAEFEQDLLSSPEDLLIPDSEDDMISPLKENYQMYFKDVVPNNNDYSKSSALSSKHHQDIKITSTNQQSRYNSNSYLNTDCHGNNNSHKTTDYKQPSGNCKPSLSGGLQSPTVSSTQVGKICLSPASDSSFSDSDFYENQNKSKKTVTTSTSIGVQTAYSNTDHFHFTQYSRRNEGQGAKNRMSELEQHLRGYKSCGNSPTSECLECANIERHSKVTPFLHKLLTGEISRDLYHQVDKLLLDTQNGN